MRIALIGYGKMGKIIEDIAISRGHVISVKCNSEFTVEQADFSDTDVAIEFTLPNLAVKHMEFCIENQIPIVVGTTAWNEELDYIKELVLTKNGSLLHASNFSIGVNVFFEINRKLASLMSSHPEYKISLDEIHHVQKIDAPSGTAVTLANEIMMHHENANSWTHSRESKPETSEGQIAVTSFRKPNVPGTHEIRYTSEIDEIEIKHTAFNRKGFALGAILAAEWLANKKGIYTMQDIIKL